MDSDILLTLRKRLEQDLATCESALEIDYDTFKRSGLEVGTDKAPLPGVSYHVSSSMRFGHNVYGYRISMRPTGGYLDRVDAYTELVNAMLENDYEKVAEHLTCERLRRYAREETKRKEFEAKVAQAIKEKDEADARLRGLLQA